MPADTRPKIHPFTESTIQSRLQSILRVRYFFVELNNSITNRKKSIMKHDQNRGDLRNTWQIINELTSRKSKGTFVNEVILNNGNSIHDPLELSEAFNDHFSNIGPRLANEIHVNENCPSYVDYLSGTCDSRFELKTTTVSTVFSLLSKLSKSKATGLDKIPARLLRDCADLIASPLCTIFNQSGVFPDEWKLSKVIPLFKQGERSDLNSYRPISIVPVVAKVFERIIYDQLYNFLTDNNLISSCQSVFRSLHSTATLVQPHFDYCSEIWGCCNKTLSSKLQKLQNRAARILLRASYDTNSDSLIDKLGWRKLDKQRLINKATMV